MVPSSAVPNRRRARYSGSKEGIRATNEAMRLVYYLINRYHYLYSAATPKRIWLIGPDPPHFPGDARTSAATARGERDPMDGSALCDRRHPAVLVVEHAPSRGGTRSRLGSTSHRPRRRRDACALRRSVRDRRASGRHDIHQ